MRDTNMYVFDGVLHNVLKIPVNKKKQSTLLGHLLHDILGGEDWIQIEPLRLHFQPFIDRLLYPNYAVLPLFYFLLKRLDELWSFHCNCLHDLIVEYRLDVFDGCEDADSRVSVWRQVEQNVFPFVLHFLHAFLQSEFLARKQNVFEKSNNCYNTVRLQK